MDKSDDIESVAVWCPFFLSLLFLELLTLLIEPWKPSIQKYVSWASILSVYPGYPGNIIATEALWFVSWTGWSFCKTRGWDRMEIPNPFISTCLISQAREHKFYLVAAFVRAMVELNWGGIPFRKELVSHENPAWSTELLLRDRFWYPIGLCVQKSRLSPTSLERVGKAKSLDWDLQSDTSLSTQSAAGWNLDTLPFTPTCGAFPSALCCAQAKQLPLTLQKKVPFPL